MHCFPPNEMHFRRLQTSLSSTSVVYSRNMTGCDASLVGAYIVYIRKFCVNVTLKTSKAIDVRQIWEYLERQREEYQETRLTIAIIVGKLVVGGQRRKRRHPTRDVSGGMPAAEGAAGRCQSVRGSGRARAGLSRHMSENNFLERRPARARHPRPRRPRHEKSGPAVNDRRTLRWCVKWAKTI